MSSYSIEVPMDDDGFIRRECPNCEHEFKWHSGPTDDRPLGEIDPSVYFCPLCGESALTDQWWTQTQVEFQQQFIMSHLHEEVEHGLKDAFRGMKGWTYKPGRNDEPTPASLTEPNDMLIIQPPCHPWEPLKIPNDHLGPVHCLICGQQFAV